MPKNKAAQALGSLGGKATAAKGTTDKQRAARRANAAKALKARMDKRQKENDNGSVSTKES